MSAPILRVVTQRHDGDCSVAVLGTYLGVSYEEALIALAHCQPAVLSVGVDCRHIVAASKMLGVRLVRRKTFDMDSDEGIAWVVSDDMESDHVVVMKQGLVIDTDGTIWEAEDYMRANNAEFDLLLVRSDES